MPESALTEKELLKKKRNAVRYIFEREIVDKNICQYIFGEKGYTEDAIRATNKYPVYFNNILSLVFYFIYACYRCDLDEGYGDFDGLTGQNAKRIHGSLKNVFKKFPVTADLIQFVLTDVQFELAQGSSGELLGVFNRLGIRDKKFNFIPYFDIISNYSESRFQFSKLEATDLFLELLNNLTFLNQYELQQLDSDRFCFVSKTYADKQKYGITGDKEKYDELYLDHVLFCDEQYFGGIYSLFNIETFEVGSGSNQTVGITLRYLTPDGNTCLTFSIPEEEGAVADHLAGQNSNCVFEEILGDAELSLDQDEQLLKKNSNSIDQIHMVNYKYIKNLALAISDNISSNEGLAEKIYKRFSPNYAYIFEKCYVEGKIVDYRTFDWDSIVIMLLIEASPSKVLEYIVRADKEMFYKIAGNLYKRVYDVEQLHGFDDRNYLKQQVINIIDTRLVLGEASGFGNLRNEKSREKLFPRAASMLILSRLNDLQETEVDETLIYTGNLQDNISLLQNSTNELDCEKLVRNACIILGETLRHLMCFYSGLFAYGKQKEIHGFRSRKVAYSKEKLKSIKEQLDQAFLAGAKQQAEWLPKELTVDTHSVLNMVSVFIDFCKKCSTANAAVSGYSLQLYEAIGRYEIIHIRKFVNLVCQLKEITGEVTVAKAEAWVKATLNILEYFKVGTCGHSQGDMDLLKAVYPYTAVFKRGKENLDGYRTVVFSLDIDIDEDNLTDLHHDVNVLSEFEYERSQVYYCLPNTIRSNHKWWIDPLLINFKEFNDIFFGEQKG